MQGFYEDIENYVYASTKIAIYSKLNKKSPNLKSQITQEYLNNLRIKEVSFGFINQKLGEYSKYLGITKNSQNHIRNYSEIQIKIHIKSYEDVILEGKTEDFDLDQRIRPSYEPLIDDLVNITPEEINTIINYFKGLRTYWKNHYSKSLLKIIKIRPNLKPKIDFINLNG